MTSDLQLLVNVDVPDLDAATRFYTQAFGFHVGRRFGPGGADGVELLGAAAPLYLLPQPAGSAAAPGGSVRSYARHWTPVHLDLVVPDVRLARARALDAGATAEGEIAEHAWGHLARLADPFGHGVCLIEFRGRGYDEIRSP